MLKICDSPSTHGSWHRCRSGWCGARSRDLTGEIAATRTGEKVAAIGFGEAKKSHDRSLWFAIEPDSGFQPSLAVAH
jgi:hypothetical protein